MLPVWPKATGNALALSLDLRQLALLLVQRIGKGAIRIGGRWQSGLISWALTQLITRTIGNKMCYGA